MSMRRPVLIIVNGLPPLALGSQLVEINTTTPQSFDYADLLQHVHAVLLRAPADHIS